MDLFDKFIDDFHKSCEGCSVLQQPKKEHKILASNLKEADILFLTGSYVENQFGAIKPIAYDEHEYLKLVLDGLNYRGTYEIDAAFKCYSLKEKELATQDFHLCRPNLEHTINAVKPKLIIPLGNLAFKLITKKSGIMDKRGSGFEYSGIPVVPTLNIRSVILEPKFKFVFQSDIRNAINKNLDNSIQEFKLKYTFINSIDMLDDYKELLTTDEPIAIDIETEGLDFNVDKIHTLAISTKSYNVVFPLFHFDSPIVGEDREVLLEFLKNVMQNPNNKKVFHNAQFDVKFLYKLGWEVENMRCTAVMAHIMNEELQKGLLNLVKLYFPEKVNDL